MRDREEILKIILVTLTAIFIMVGIGTVFLAGNRKKEAHEIEKREALKQLESIPTVTPVPMVARTPTPAFTPTPVPSPSPTRAPARVPSFNPLDYTGIWYSSDGLASMDIYAINEGSVSFSFSQGVSGSAQTVEADVTAEIAGNASEFSFTDSGGNVASGTLIFDHGQLYVRIRTDRQGQGASAVPDVDCIMQRDEPWTEQTITAVPVAPSGLGDYYFPDSDSRYLTDEELSGYSSSDLELAKNEIYARHGRKFITDRISGYFSSKSWYHGTIDPETFDAMPAESVFNDYEIANISKIVEWEQKKRMEGN